MFKYEYDQIIREHFDLTDRYTRKYITSLTEDTQQDQLLAALSSALYNKIVSKVDEIDFGTIPLSRGDITKVQGFASTEECLNIIRNLVIQYKQNPTIVDVVISAVNNIKERKTTFVKGYAINAELPMLIYNTMVLAIERSTSLLIATCIEYVKDPTSNNIKMSLDKAAYNRTMDDLLFKQLINFNNLCHNGQMDKTLEEVMKNNIRSAREEVENMYNAVHVVGEEEPIAPEGVDQNPFDSDSTVEPFDNRTSEEQPFDNSDDTMPEPEDFPEDTEEYPSDMPTPTDIQDDEEYVTTSADDEVEPDNIPTVNPGDSVTDSDTAINELEDDDEYDETNNGTPFIPETDSVEEGLLGTAVNTGVAVASFAVGVIKLPFTVLKLVLALLRTVIYYFYYTKMKLSDCLEVQADLIEANANDLQYSTTSDLSDEQKGKVVKKQRKTAEKLRKWANKFAIDSKTTSNKAGKAAQDDDRNKNTIGRNDYDEDSIF